VTGNLANGNLGDGIESASYATCLGNTVSSNTGFGLRLTAADGYGHNVINNNTGGTVTGGIQIDTNVCNGNTTCP